MSWDLTDNEYRSALAMKPRERYRYALRKMVDWEEIWTLDIEGAWTHGRDRHGCLAIPIWPHRRFAQDCAIGPWLGAKPVKVGLGVWMARYVRELTQCGKNIVVFDTRRGEALFVKPAEHLVDLQKELRRLQ